MPIYEYKCSSCSKTFEELVSSTNNDTASCIHCGGKSSRILSKTSFQLKGGGWYATEYGKQAQSSSIESNSSNSETPSSCGKQCSPDCGVSSSKEE